MVERVEMVYGGRTVTAECVSFGVSASGPAAPSDAEWHITFDGVTRSGFPAGHEDTDQTVKQRICAWAQAHPELFGGASFKGYWIEPRPNQLRDTNEWTLEIQIKRANHGELRVQVFSASNTFQTREEAVTQGIQFGQRIIDGKVRDCSVAGL